jgi:hypothetical protein
VEEVRVHVEHATRHEAVDGPLHESAIGISQFGDELDRHVLRAAASR